LKNREKALEILAKGFRELKSPNLLWQQADWQIDADEIEPAQKSVQQLAAKNFDQRALEYLRGKISFAQKKWMPASRSLESCRSYFANQPDTAKVVEYLLAICYGNLGNDDQRTSALRRSLAIDPGFEAARVALTAITAQNKQTIDLPLKDIIALIKSSKDTRALSTLIPLAIATKKQLPKDEQNWKEMQDILDEVGKNFPDYEDLPLFRCNMLIAQDRGEEAEKMLHELAVKHPKNSQYWLVLTSWYVQKKKFDEAEKCLTAFEKAAGDTVELRLMKMNYCLRRQGKEALPQLKALGEKTDAFDDQQKNLLWQNLLGAMREIGARDEMAALTKLMAERDPNNINYLIFSFEQASETGDIKRLEKISNDIERLEGNGPYWYTTQAIICIQKAAAGGDAALLDEALKLLDKAKEKRPNWAKIPFLTGRIYDAKNDPKNALKFYQDTIELHDYQPIAIMRIVDILCQRQNIRDAHVFLQRLERDQAALSAETLKKWVAILLNPDIHDYEAALEKARKVTAGKTENYKDLIWFGQALAEIDRLTSSPNRKKVFDNLIPEAEKSLRRAVELNPDAPEGWKNLINFLVSVDKLSEAETTFDEARKKFTGKEGQLSIAQCLELLKKYEQAKEEYELLLSADPKDVRTTRIVAEFFIRMSGANQAERATYVKQAESLLNRMIESKDVKADPEDVLWARNKLALIISTRPGYENVEKARNLVAKNLEAEPDSTADLRLLAQINCMDPRQSNRQEAIRVYTELLKSQRASNDDRLGLAYLYLANGNWNGASEVLRDLAINASDDPKYLSIYIRELLDHGEVSDADIYLHQLQDKWPNHLGTFILRAELLARTNKAEEGLDLLKSFIDRPNAIPNDRSQRIKMIAQTMEDFVTRVIGAEQKVDAERFLRTAELYLRQYADDHPSATMQVVEFLARQRRFDDAIDMLEQNWKAANPVTLYQACILTTEAGHGSKEITDRVIKIMTEARTQFDDHPTVLLTLADIKVGGQQYKEAEAFYREILAKNTGHTVAMNNLAVLLTVSKKNLPEALDLINKAIGITGPLAQMLDTRACVYVAMGKSEKALADMKDVLADKKTPDRLFHQAQALEGAGQNNAAAVAMQEALQMGLSEKSLLTPEVPTFQRLRDMAHSLSPVKKSGKTPPKK
jgi:tetratricopeptide (TPR) repeat protein